MLVEVPQNPKVLRKRQQSSGWEISSMDVLQNGDVVKFFESDWKIIQLKEGSIFISGSEPVRIKSVADRRRIDVEFI